MQMRTRVMNQLQAIAINEGVRRKQQVWSAQSESLHLNPWATRRRQELLQLLYQLAPRIEEELSAAIEQQAERRPEVQLLMTQPASARSPRWLLF